MKKTRNLITAAGTAAVLTAGAFFFFASGHTGSLLAVEVKNYQGQNLSSINDFRENSIEGPQQIDIAKYRLSVGGLVKKPLSYAYNDVLKFNKFSKVVTLNCVEGWSVKILWEGILIKDILEKSGIDSKADTVIFYAHDGYSTSLPLDYIIKNNIMMAYSMNGETLHPNRGYPFQLVAEDKWGYKWIKWITKIECSNDRRFRGYWEKRGFSQSGDLDKSYDE